MASVFVYLFLPLAGLTILWKRNEIWAKLWMNAVAFHSFGRRKLLLNWAKRRLPPNWSSYMETLSGGIGDFWNDGSLLCTLINTAVPGACPNPYRHWQETLAHAQDVAYKYLGVIPIFSESDFTSSLTPYLEKKLVDYLALIQKSASKLEKDRLFYSFISSRHVVRGMGLYTAEQFKESDFFIYSKIQNPSFYNVEILILGPYSTYCRTTVLDSLLKESKRLDNDSKEDSGSKISSSWLKAKECYLDKLRDLNDSQMTSENSIDIRVKLEYDRVKVSYISINYGIHEVNLSCNKEVIVGSPFYVNVLKSLSDSTEKKNNIKDMLIENREAEKYELKDVDNQQYANTPKPNEISLNTANNLIKEKTQNISNMTSEQRRKDTVGDRNNNKCIDKIQNNFNEKGSYKNVTGNLPTNGKPDSAVELPTVNNFDLGKESTLQISKYLKDLHNSKKVNADNRQETSFHFSKENYSYFQQAVDCSFRKSCKITRTLPRLVQTNYPVVPGASPICNKHTVPEDLGKLSAGEKRKKFAQNCRSQRTSSLFSAPEDLQERISSNKDVKTIQEEPIDIKNNSRSTKTNKSFNKLVSVKNNKIKDSSIHRIVKEKKLFWETVFQSSKQMDASHDIKITKSNANNSFIPFKTKNFKTEGHLAQKQESDVHGKSPASCGSRYIDSLCLLKRHTISKSFCDLSYIERKRLLVKYKSMDENLDQCCNISLDNRTRIYLDHISSFNSKFKEEHRSCVNLVTNKHNKEKNQKQVDDVSKSPNSSLSSEGKARTESLKITLKKSIEYFKNLESIESKTRDTSCVNAYYKDVDSTSAATEERCKNLKDNNIIKDNNT